MNPSPEDQAFVSVVVPCFNGMKTIGDCLSSLADQTYSRDRFEVLLVDNGSRDGTCEFVQASFPWVRLVHCSEKGSGYARNAGIREARGELLLSTDSDCVADKSWIAQLVTLFQQAPPEVAAIGGIIRPFSTRTAVEKYKRTWVGQPNANGKEPGVRYTATPNAAFRTSIIRLVGSFDGALGFDDTDLGIRLIKAGYQIQYTDLAIVYHRNPASLAELYQHKSKYGKFGFDLARKHPEVLGQSTLGDELRKLRVASARRVLGNLLVRLPVSLVAGSADAPRVWPLIDAVIAVANYKGFSRAATHARNQGQGGS